MLERRRAGVLLHPTSLPGSGSQGSFGADARRFVDLIASAGFTIWQILPLGPVDGSRSPYLLKSAHAGDPRFIDTTMLKAEGLLGATGKDPAPGDHNNGAWWQHDHSLLINAFANNASASLRAEYDAWREQNQHWLPRYALFEALHQAHGRRSWWEWPAGLRDFRQKDLAAAARKLDNQIAACELLQFYFDRQWQLLREYANERGICILGDLPFYMDRDSVEVWSQGGLFDLDHSKVPIDVAGCPPDYFSEDGQWWGNPVYAWAAHAADGFAWWLDRIGTQAKRFDGLRIDHFRALESFWAIPRDAKTAREGCWLPSPGSELLGAIRDSFPELAIVAEDLGVITDPVRELRDRFDFPGMAILQFAFDGSTDNPYLPENHDRRSVVYTGTHDNDTIVGWFNELDAQTRSYVGEIVGPGPMPEALIDLAYNSVANTAIVPMQDLLGLGTEARMNLPGTTEGNWKWRLSWDAIPADFASRFRTLAIASERL